MLRFVFTALLTCLLAAAPSLAQESPRPREFREVALDGGGKMRYALVTPDGFREGGTYPVLLALPPGQQDEDMVEAGLQRYWEAEAIKRGWVVASPAARGDTPMNDDIPALLAVLDAVGKAVKIEGKVHLAGISNGGRTAIRLGTLHPERFASMMLLPGRPASDEDFARLDKIKNIPVTLYVGEQDRSWVQESTRVEQELRRLGGRVTLHVLEKQPHVVK